MTKNYQKLAKMTMNDLKWQHKKVSKYAKSSKNVSINDNKWFKMVKNGQKWLKCFETFWYNLKMTINDQKWWMTKNGKNDQK